MKEKIRTRLVHLRSKLESFTAPTWLDRGKTRLAVILVLVGVILGYLVFAIRYARPGDFLFLPKLLIESKAYADPSLEVGVLVDRLNSWNSLIKSNTCAQAVIAEDLVEDLLEKQFTKFSGFQAEMVVEALPSLSQDSSCTPVIINIPELKFLLITKYESEQITEYLFTSIKSYSEYLDQVKQDLEEGEIEQSQKDIISGLVVLAEKNLESMNKKGASIGEQVEAVFDSYQLDLISANIGGNLAGESSTHNWEQMVDTMCRLYKGEKQEPRCIYNGLNGEWNSINLSDSNSVIKLQQGRELFGDVFESIVNPELSELVTSPDN